jgi:predicted dehydrogenase
MTLTRRSLLLLGASAGAAIAAGCSTSPKALQPLPAGRPARFGIVGLRSRGNDLWEGLRKLADVRVTAVCDVDPAVLDQRLSQAAARGEQPERFLAAEELFANGEVDAVAIATPNHTHAVLAARALRAGKHVYVEKPVSHDVDEGLRLLAVQRQTGLLVQAGTQNRSDTALRPAFADLRAGRFGAIERVHGLCLRDRDGIGKRETMLSPPNGLAYDRWLGPAQDEPIHRSQFHYDWHWQWNTGNGDFGNQAPHELDMVCWALGDPGLPEQAFALGGRFAWQDAGETANAMAAAFLFPEGIPIAFEVRNLKPKRKETSAWHGLQEPAIAVVCAHGELRARRGGAAFYDRRGELVQQWRGDGGATHLANFVAAMRAGDATLLTAPLGPSVASAALAHLGNASLRLGPPGDAAAARAAATAWPGLLEHVERLHEQLHDHGVDLTRTPWAIGPVLQVDRATGFVTGPQAVAANALLRRAPRRGWAI